MQQCIVAILFYLQVYNYVQSSNTFHRQDSLICSSHCIIITRGSSICVTCRSVYNQDQNGIKRSTFFFRSWPRDQDGLWLTNVNGPAYLLIKILRRHGNIFFLSFWTPVKSNDQEFWKGVIKAIKDNIHCSRLLIPFWGQYVQGIYSIAVTASSIPHPVTQCDITWVDPECQRS